MRIVKKRKEMDKKRLLEIIDLVEQAERLWRCDVNARTHAVTLEISSNSGPLVRVFENVGPNSVTAVYQHRKPTYADWIESDPDLKKAEAHIRRLLKEEE